MDRLSTLIQHLVFVAVFFTLGCESKETIAPPKSRVVAVRAKTKTTDSLAGFCDVMAKKNQGRQFQLPELSNPIKLPTDKPVWINVWATWCKPCIEEMPMLVKWHEQFKRDGIALALEFLSVDETVEMVTDFQKRNPQTPKSLHIKNPEVLEAWITELGLDKGAGLPFHIFIEPEGRIRCIRAAAINPGHYKTITQLLK